MGGLPQRYSTATFWPATNPASFRPCSNAVTRCSEPAADVLRRNPITGTADCCARAVNGHATTVLLKRLMNSRRLMASPAPRTKSGIKRLSHFWIENCAVRRTQARPQPCPLYPRKRTSPSALECPLSAMCGRLRVGKGYFHVRRVSRCSHVFGLFARFT